MAKQLIISVMEDVVGEYILNISKENLKLAALRGKVKLENVQLDGELIGSHVLGAMGLSGFGVLSCYARSLKMIVPLKNIEKEPTRFEIYGLHLVCVPLLPSTANKLYGAGTAVDPRCTLRTRAKRSELARFERNYFSGRIPGEGPPSRRVKKAAEVAEKALRKSKGQLKDALNRSMDDVTLQTEVTGDTSEAIDESFMSDISFNSESGDKSFNMEKLPAVFRIPIVQQNWKTRLREKVLRNIEASIHEIHVRCEVAENGLEFGQRGQSGPLDSDRSGQKLSAEQRSFSFGLTGKSFIIRSANENWEAGTSFLSTGDDAASQSSSLPGSTHCAKRTEMGERRIAELNDVSLYWDDAPPVLISESYVLRMNDHRLSPSKLQAKISAAMDALVAGQNPGDAIRKSLLVRDQGSPSQRNGISTGSASIAHSYCIDSFSLTMHGTLGERDTPGPMVLFAEVLPMSVELNLAPHQCLQYQKLRSAMLSQQRFDTMVHQRPSKGPCENPRAWWKYAFACVTTRPTSRPWSDVLRISRCRTRYVGLVMKKFQNSSVGNGFHGGLTDKESLELLALEDLLPIEALLAFHLLACRKVYDAQKQEAAMSENGSGNIKNEAGSAARNRRGLRRLRRALSGVGRKSKDTDRLVSSDTEMETGLLRSASFDCDSIPVGSTRKSSLLEIVTRRIGKKTWFNTFKMSDIKIAVNLLDSSEEASRLRLEVRTSGSARTFGPSKRDLLFDVMQFDLTDQSEFRRPLSQSHCFFDGKILTVDEPRPQHETWLETVDYDNPLIESLPSGVVCRISSSHDISSLKLSVSAHPATLVWNKSSIDSLADFFSGASSELQTELTRQLRNVATPLARKAHLALLSPAFLVLNVNIAAPKVWLPVSSDGKDGAVYLDAGRLKVACSKRNNEADPSWRISTSDIQVTLNRPRKLVAISTTMNEELPIVRPFHVKVDISMIDGSRKLFDKFPLVDEADFISNRTICITSVAISPICLNLVDAEALARAIGHWYASGLVKAKNRVAASGVSKEATSQQHRQVVDLHPAALDDQGMSTTPQLVAVGVEKLELALEGHSKMQFSSSDDQSTSSFGSYDTFGPTPSTRTYIVEVFDLNIARIKQDSMTQTKLSVLDASILQIKDILSKAPSHRPLQTNDTHFRILVSEEKDRPRTISTLHDYDLPALSMPVSPEDEDERFGDLSEKSASPRLRHFSCENMTGEISELKTNSSLSRGIFSACFLHDGRDHVDEVDIDIESLVVRITPTSLKDCAKGLRRILELIQLVTRELERKVHEEGRKARQKSRRSRVGEMLLSETLRPISPITSEANSNMTFATDTPQQMPSDSSILFRVTLKESTLLAGQPALLGPMLPKPGSDAMPTSRSSFEVVQMVAKSLIMFQSIENPDTSGSKTVHISLDSLSASVDTEFERVAAAEVPPMVGPSAAEFRVVYQTENQGCVVSQDVSVNFEATSASLTPDDISIFTNVSRHVAARLRSFGLYRLNQSGVSDVVASSPVRRPFLIRYQKKGTGIATSVQLEIDLFSLVLLRTHRSRIGTKPLIDVTLKHVKGKLEGCMSALSGEFSSVLSANSFNSEVADWEHIVEPLAVVLTIEQMPNELILKLSCSDALRTNLTSRLLKDISRMDFRSRNTQHQKTDAGTPSNATRLMMRRAPDIQSVSLSNLSGIDVCVAPMASERSKHGSEEKIVRSGNQILLDPIIGAGEIQKLCEPHSSSVPRVSLSVAPSAVAEVGERRPILDLPVASSSGKSVALHRLQPVQSKSSNERDNPLVWKHVSGRSTPESHFSELSSVGGSDFAYYNAEPVVEWCMQNQRLRSNVSDVFSLEKGRDLLSSRIWSPEDDMIEEPEDMENQGHEPAEHSYSWDGTEAEVSRRRKPQPEPKTSTLTRTSQKGNWVRPYLKTDSPEWTDMTCILRMARERVMLPDNNWIWLNDWSIDLSGSYGESTDADGWEYEADFETFTRTRRFYSRGDSCRRRRWTRTRIVRPPALDDPYRQLSIVWETQRDEDGNFALTVRSPIVIHNRTPLHLAFFANSPSWDDDYYVGSAKAGSDVYVPVPLSSATYIRFGKQRQPGSAMKQASKLVRDYAVTGRVLILPTSYTSSVLVRTVIKLDEFVEEDSPTDASEADLHFIVHIKCRKGATDIFVDPVLRVVNLLPCQIQCELGQVTSASDPRVDHVRPVPGRKGKKIVGMETLIISTGEEGLSTAMNPSLKPHIALRVPGYQWSAWQRIVNRMAKSHTWQPSDLEEEWRINPNIADADFADEFNTSVRFERIGNAGDPLVLIISVEAGHCPTIRIYAQYWILDKTGFGCRFCDGFTDLLGTIPDGDTSRRSHLLAEEAKDPDIQKEMDVPGHEWSIGMSGMSLFFSRKERIALSIESGASDERSNSSKRLIRSKWVAPMDVSNVMPKTVFSVDEYGGPRRYDLAMSVTLCPELFARTKLITLYPRYQIVNLLGRKLIVAQEGCLKSPMVIPSQSSVPFHRERQSLPPKVRLGAPSSTQLHDREYDESWTNGCIQMDKIGITSMRLPTDRALSGVFKPMVVQVEVRLATKDQPSAVVVVIWSTNEKSNPLYIIRNRTKQTIICRQPLHDEPGEPREPADAMISLDSCSADIVSPGGRRREHHPGVECGAELAPIIRAFLCMDQIEEFVWILRSDEVTCFGFDDPEKPHIIEWTSVENDGSPFEQSSARAYIEVDAMGSSSELALLNGTQIQCRIVAEHSTKVIEFFERGELRRRRTPTRAEEFGRLRKRGRHLMDMMSSGNHDGSTEQTESHDIDEEVAFSFRVDLPEIHVSVIDNDTPMVSGREILLAQFDRLVVEFSQNREGYHEFEFTLMSLQVDNHVHKSIHPVLVFCPQTEQNEPLLHMSAVRRLQPHSSTFVFRYAAVRLLEIDIFLDRRTAETVARFVRPLGKEKQVEHEDPRHWIRQMTLLMALKFARPDRRAPRDIEQMALTANVGRIYFEQLHLHPVRLALTFTQEWMEWNPGAETMMIFQFIRGMASIANAPLTFTSFVVGHVFESPQSLMRIVATHYSSQLTKQIFGILGSLAILGAPADFISNVGTGVRDFFYEPINGMVHGPAQFIEGLEAGTQSLARGVFVGVVRGAANVTEVVNANLAGLTADDNFIDERKAHQRMLTDAMSRGVTSRSMKDSLSLAGASIARGVKSGALGIVEQPALYASRHGPVGLVKGVGKALVGAVLKPAVGIGDAAVLVLNHVSDATSNKQVVPKIPKRLRRALPWRSSDKPHCVQLSPYDERAAKAQKIVTGGESVEDVYIGHVNIPSHLIIASGQCLWAIDRRSREPWCVSWEEISHFGMLDSTTMRITVFSQTGLKSYVFKVSDSYEFAELHRLMVMQMRKMGNGPSDPSLLGGSLFRGGLENLSRFDIPGIKARQVDHVFGSCNKTRKRLSSTVKDEIDVIEQCFARVKEIGSDSPTFFKTLDVEAWSLVNSWGQVFSGLSSRRCIVASIINGTGNDIQIKSTKLVEGGSPCYSIPSKEYDSEHGILHAGGAIIFFGWGVVPNLLQAGSVFMNIETNAFVSDLSDHKSRSTYAEALSGYEVGFLEKSYDESGWWAKYWLLVRKA